MRFLFLFILLSAQHSAAEPISAKQLRQEANRYDADAQKKGVSPSDLKSMLGILDGKDAVIYYTYKGTTYPGIQLPNGTLAPAVINNHNRKSPGCLANDGKIYPAQWQTDRLICQLPQNENGLLPVEQRVDVGRVASLQADQPPGYGLIKYNDEDNDEEQETTTTPHTATASTQAPKIKARPIADPNRYIPPKRTHASNPSMAYSVQHDTSKFGISFGTWASAEIKRSVTNADAGEVEVILTETIKGRQKSLPMNTVLYGHKSFNSGTNRLDLRITRGITPEGEEIRLIATAYSQDRAFSGLSGVLLRNREQEVNTLAKNTTLQTASAALGQLSPNDPILGTAYESVTQQAINNEQRHIKQQSGSVIKVFPQPIHIRIDSSF